LTLTVHVGQEPNLWQYKGYADFRGDLLESERVMRVGLSVENGDFCFYCSL